MIDNAHPVGSYYLTETDTNPSAILHVGTWVQLKDRMLIGCGDSFAISSEGGEITHTLTSAEFPKLSGSVATFLRWNNSATATGILSAENGTTQFPSTENQNTWGSTIKIAFGGNQPHNNMPPYHTCFVWRRES